jgi:hypothetical protein
MPDPGFFTLADTLGSASSVAVFIFLGVALLIFWQVAILAGAWVASLWRETREKRGGPVEVS